MGRRAYVDHDRCASSGACVLERPDVFAYQEGPEALAIVRPDAPDLSDEELREAVELCPMEAIRVLDDAGTDVTTDAA